MGSPTGVFGKSSEMPVGNSGKHVQLTLPPSCELQNRRDCDSRQSLPRRFARVWVTARNAPRNNLLHVFAQLFMTRSVSKDARTSQHLFHPNAGKQDRPAIGLSMHFSSQQMNVTQTKLVTP